MTSLVRYEVRSSIAIITLNRADKRNALSQALIQEMTQCFSQVRDDQKVRCVIFTGEGTAFCAGMDLDELRSTLTADANQIKDAALQLAHLFDLIYTLPKPTIAAVNGAAVAGGAGMVSVCDLAVSVPTAKFGYPEVRRGLVAAMVMPHLLRHVGERMARYLLLTGELIDAETALKCGFINQIVPADELLNTALSWAKSCSEGGPLALASTKRVLTELGRSTLSVDQLAGESASPRFGEECRKGLEAFFNKQPVPWTINDNTIS
jgi:methylglutaconyl-CoA hydratase